MFPVTTVTTQGYCWTCGEFTVIAMPTCLCATCYARWLVVYRSPVIFLPYDVDGTPFTRQDFELASLPEERLIKMRAHTGLLCTPVSGPKVGTIAPDRKMIKGLHS